jgi:carbohydrate diacid regulator
MVFAASLGHEVGDYIKNLLNRDVLLVDERRNCVISPNQTEVGSTINLPKDVEFQSSPKDIELNGRNNTLIPLRYESKNVAYLIINDSNAEIKSYSPLIKSFAELLIQQHYANNKPVLDRSDHFISNLFENYNPANSSEYESEAKMLGYDLSVKRVALTVHLKGFWDNCLLDIDQPSFERDQIIGNWKRNLEKSINSFFTKNADLIIAYVGSDKFVVFKAVETGDEENIKKLLKKSYKSIFEQLKNHRIKSVTVGYGNAYSNVEGLISAKRESDLTLELGQKIWGEDQSYFFDDLGLLSILGDGDREKKVDFADQLLSKLKNGDLNKTLECFFEHNLNLTETSEEMGIHRNTVIYRLNQITKILNADPRIFEQAMSIKIALIVRSLFGDSNNQIKL